MRAQLAMSMDFGFDVISAEEYDRQRALYAPLTEAMRELIDAGIHTEADEDDRPRGAGGHRGGDRRCSSASSAA